MNTDPSWTDRRTTFEQAALFYDEARPGYPEALFDDLARLAGLPDGGRILEIGCGTGKASVPLARRGYRIHCVELGPNLADVARYNLAPYPQAEVIVAPFEEWPGESAAYDLVTAATAFHWLDPATALPKVARLLRPGGAIAIFRHHHVPSRGSAPFFEAVQEVYQAVVPEMASRYRLIPAEEFPAAEEPNTARQIDESGLFEAVTTLRYEWDEPYDAASYIRLLSTYSDHIRLAPETRTKLFAGITALINDQFGGHIVKGYMALLHVASRR